MREPLRDRERLEHILDAIDKLQTNTVGAWQQKISSEPLLYYSLVKLLEIIGEAAYKLTKEFKEEHPQTEWRVIENMRHILVHGYYSIHQEIVWSTLEKDLTPLKTQIKQYLSLLH